LVLGLSLLILFHQPFPFSKWFFPDSNWELENWLREDMGFPFSFRWPAVVLAQFAVSCAFSIRTMRVTFDQIHPRAEDVARTLGCTRGQAFLLIALPQAWKGMIAATMIAWARALGEFGPIMVFAGTTRFRTEVLSTTVFLELSVGKLDAAVAVSLLMVGMAVIVLLVLRWIGATLSS
jgi:molybdate transport system permease protein